MLQPRVFGGLVSLLLWCSCATVDPARPRLPADVAFNQNAGRGTWLFVTLRLESGEQLPFLLDTGTPWTFFDKSREPKLGKRLDAGINWHFGTKLESGIYAAPKLYLGRTPLLMTGTNVGTLDCREISTKAGRPVLGILGMDCLKHYCIQLDFAARRMRFLDGERADKKGWGKAFPLTDRGDGCLLVGEKLAGAKGAGSLIDTGANYDGWLMPDLFQQWTNHAQLPADGEARSPNGVLGGATYPEIWLDRLDAKSMIPDETNIQYNSIGLRFLARHLVTLDFPKRTLYLKRISRLPLVDKDAQRRMRATGKSAYLFLHSLQKKGQLPRLVEKGSIRLQSRDRELPSSRFGSLRSCAEKRRYLHLSLRVYPSLQDQPVEAAKSLARGSKRPHGRRISCPLSFASRNQTLF